ncbi:hypothetical protein BC830DRAFT_1220999, partial [Chytriomyces sp. MP71]
MSRAAASTPRHRHHGIGGTHSHSSSSFGLSHSRLSNYDAGRDSRASNSNVDADYELRDDLPQAGPVSDPGPTARSGWTHEGRFKRFGKSNTFVQKSNQLALFSDGNLWQAVYESDLDNVKKYSVENFCEADGRVIGTRGECERGGEGETILHLAILSLRKNEEPAKKVVFWIIDRFRVLVNEVYLKHRYFGETPLHVAVVTSKLDDLEVIEELVNAGAQINGPMVTGTEFLKDEDKGVLYYGQSILQFAAATHRNKILRYLVEQGALLETVDLYGNNVLHIMAYYGDYDKEVFLWIKKRNQEDLTAKRTTVDLMRARNKDNLTPFQLGIARGHRHIIEMTKETVWEFGFVRCYKIPIDDLDPIQPHREQHDNSLIRISKSAMEIAADKKDKAIITHPLFDSLLQVKWALYARKIFLFRFVLTCLLVITLTIALALQPYSLVDRRTYFTAVAGTNSYPIVRLVFEILSLLGVVVMLAGEVGEFKTQRFGYFHGYGADENVVQWVFSLMVLVIPILRFGVAAAVDSGVWYYIVDTENIIMGLSGILGWIYLLFFSKGFESIGPLVFVFTKIIREDLLQWLSLYVAVTMGFSAALFLQMNDAPEETANELIPILDWNNYLGSTLWVIRFVFAQSIFDDFRHAKLPGFAEFLFVLYGFMVMVLLVNVLIAKLVETFKDVAKDSKRYWKVQFAHLIIGIDEKMNDFDRRYWLTHLGWHDGPSKHILNERAAKRGSKKYKDAEDGASADSIIAQRYFIFTERDVPDPHDPSKRKTETLKLTVAKNYEGKDIE